MFFRKGTDAPVEVMAIETLRKRIEQGSAPVIVDVRESDEWDAGHISQARHIPLFELPQRVEELDPEEEIVLVCKSGYRSLRAGLFLKQRGFERVWNLDGGMDAWE